jgi:Wall-associated receptor kinase galacturonan-binding
MAPPHLSLLLFLLPLLVVLHCAWAASQTSPLVSLPGCRNKCGNITVPYPFGFEPNCFREDFKLVCDESHNPPQLLIDTLPYEITSISTGGRLHISVRATRDCYNSSGSIVSSTSSMYIDLTRTSTYLLSVSNSFFVLGCPEQGYFIDESGNYATGCVSVCRTCQTTLGGYNGPCNLTGYCQSSVPYALNYYEPFLQRFQVNGADPISANGNATNCSYAFLADPNWFNFKSSYLSRTDDFDVQLGIDWAVRNVRNCSYARRNMTDYACRSLNHNCSDSVNGVGYLCNCSQGYQGNPYIREGCQGIVISHEILLLYNQIQTGGPPFRCFR